LPVRKFHANGARKKSLPYRHWHGLDVKRAKPPVKIPQKTIKNVQKTAKKCKFALAHLTIRGFR
jgi:hypothetical protein